MDGKEKPAGNFYQTVKDRINRSSTIDRFFSLSERMDSWTYLRWTLLALLPVLILLRYPVDQVDYDVWWQMALGKYYLTHHTLTVDHSIFSWTPADSGWVYNTFLSSIILYLAYQFMGGFGLWMVQWMVFAGIFLAIYFCFRLIGQRFDVTSITLIAAVGMASSLSSSYYKPELFSMLLGCWWGIILLYVKITRNVKYFYYFPFIAVLWVNMHGVFALGIGAIVLIVIGEILNTILFPRESFSADELKHLITACLLSVAATLINPYGMEYLLSIYRVSVSEIYVMSNKYIMAYVSLWSYLTNFNIIAMIREGQAALIMTLMALVMGGFFLYEFIHRRTCDFTALFINLALYWGSMRVARASYMFPLMFFFSFFYMLHRLNIRNVTRKMTVFSLIIFFVFLLSTVYSTFRYSTDNKWFGAGLEEYAPVKEVEFVKKYKPEGPIFNDYLIGGYLLWALYPDYKVFIDPRLGPYYKTVAPDYWNLVEKPATENDINHLTRKYPFKTAIIHYRDLPLVFDFINAGWRLLYFEKNAAVLVLPSVISRMSPEIQSVDLGPERFKDVKNPKVLLNVFTVYVNVNPKAGLMIYEIYRKNVSELYKLKSQHLRAMQKDLTEAMNR